MRWSWLLVLLPSADFLDFIYDTKKKKNGLVSETHVSTQESMKYPWSLCSCLRCTYVVLFPYHFCCTLLLPSFSDPENNTVFLKISHVDSAKFYGSKKVPILVKVLFVYYILYMYESESVHHSVMSNSLRPHGLWPTGLLCPWNSPDKNTGVGCHFLLQGIFLTQGSNLDLRHCRQILYYWATSETLSLYMYI